MISVAVQFEEGALPAVTANSGLNVTVSFPRVEVVPGSGIGNFSVKGNGTSTIVIPQTIGKTLLWLSTDGRLRNFDPDISPLECTFTSSTGTFVFAGAININSTIMGGYK